MIIAANWKMNPPLADAGQLVSAYTQTNFDGVQRVLFPPHPYLVHMAMRLEGSGILLGGQDCHQSAAGAFTGDVAAGMLRECGASMVLLGHSERRAGHGEDGGHEQPSRRGDARRPSRAPGARLQQGNGRVLPPARSPGAAAADRAPALC